MSRNAQHTPGPWHWQGTMKHPKSNSYLTNKDNKHILFIYYSDTVLDADAEFIVRACNAHDDMLAALEACLEHPGLDECDIDNVDFGQEPVCETIRLARAAIAKAKGQP